MAAWFCAATGAAVPTSWRAQSSNGKSGRNLPAEHAELFGATCCCWRPSSISVRLGLSTMSVVLAGRSRLRCPVTVLCCAVLCCAVLCCGWAVPCRACCAALRCAVLCCFCYAVPAVLISLWPPLRHLIDMQQCKFCIVSTSGRLWHLQTG